MAKLSDEQIAEIFKPHLREGETVSHTAYGVKQPNMLLMLPLYMLALMPGVIAVMMLTRHYLVGITEKRFIVLRIKSISNFEVLEISEYDLTEFETKPANIKKDRVFAHILIENESKPFQAKFFLTLSKSSTANLLAIAAAISAEKTA